MKKKLCITAVILVVLLGIGALLFSPHTVKNPFTQERYVYWSTAFGLINRGSVVYGRVTGIVPHHIQKTEYGEVSMDNTYISTRKDEVYINVTFLGQGATFKQKKDAINLKTRKITGWELEKDTDDAKPSIEVTYQQDGEKPYQVVYRNEAQEETTVYWTAEEYREWTEKLAHLKLVESGKGYELKITLRDDEGFYYANVDAAAIVKELQP